MLGLPICEDIWHPDVCRHLAQLGAEIFLCVNGSPYEIDKDVLRIDGVAKRRSIDTGIPLAYVNRVGGQDEVVFDGASFVVGPEGALWAQLPEWEEAVVDTVWTKVPSGSGHRWRCEAGDVAEPAEHPEDIYCAMVVALRDYVNKNRFPGVILGFRAGSIRAVRRHRGRCAGRRPGVVRDAAQPLYQPGKPRRCRRLRADAGRAARYRADRPGGRWLYRMLAPFEGARQT
jgi:hypothetical protein